MATITLDKPREVKLTLNGMLLFQEKTGIDMQKPTEMKKMTVEQMRLLLWICLKDREPKTLLGKIKRFLGIDRPLSLDDVGDLIHSGNLTEIQAAIFEAREEAVEPGN